jgi:aminoglycoside 6-adenylyltransferase
VDHARVLDNVVRWATSDDNVRAVVLEGSVARDDGSVDELSDLDIRLYVLEPATLLQSNDWFGQFGDVLVVEALENPGWHPTRLVYYVDGKIDFLVAPAATLQGKQRFGRHVRVLVDKDNLTATIAQGMAVVVVIPDDAAYSKCVNDFYAAALMYARMVVRDEPIKARVRDWDMKRLLFEMITWDHVARYGGSRDVGALGAHFREWADADVVDQLDRCWSAGLGPSREALAHTVSLFRATSARVSETAELSSFDTEPVLREIERILTRT